MQVELESRNLTVNTILLDIISAADETQKKACNNCVKFKDLNFGDSFVLANNIASGILEKVNNGTFFNSYRRKDSTLILVHDETEVIKEENNKRRIPHDDVYYGTNK